MSGTPKHSPEFRARFEALWNAGWSRPEIAEVLGMNVNTVGSTAHRWKLPTHPHARGIAGRPTPKRAGAGELALAVARTERARRPKAAKPAPKPHPVSIPTTRKCLWPLWNNHERPTHRYCHEPAQRGAYCHVHAARCYERAAHPIAREAA